jgi:hypothetical protein
MNGNVFKMFYKKYCLSNIFTIISDMEINFEKKNHTVETIPTSYRKILETEAKSIVNNAHLSVQDIMCFCQLYILSFQIIITY